MPNQFVRTVSVLLISVWLCACATVDFDYPREASTAFVDTDDTRLGRSTMGLAESHPGESAFHILSDGIEALAARLLLAARAEKSIDAQYYLITNDDIGMVFIGSLLGAADRGVRVRLLLDDIQTAGYDAGMAALDSHPNIEIRVFNPFAGRGSRIGDGITDFGRVNRRMHNKSFTVDNRATIIGGRNIAAEYFAASRDVNFGDIDVLAYGPVVQDVSSMFDLYWNYRAAASVPAFARMPDDPVAALVLLRESIVQAVDRVRDSTYSAALQSSVQNKINIDSTDFIWAPYQLVYDSPEKSDRKKAPDAASIVTPLVEILQGTTEELVIVSPYFVPLKSGIEGLVALRNDRGADVTVITNSLAATNHAIVHSGYVPARKPLLKGGVKILEVRPDVGVEGVDRGGGGAALATLHTKAFIVDKRHVFIGSFNWDPRSVDINTELGVVIDSPEIANGILDSIETQRDSRAYEVILNDAGKIRWIDRSGESEIVLKKEPQTGFWRRFYVGFMRILPIKSQL